MFFYSANQMQAPCQTYPLHILL